MSRADVHDSSKLNPPELEAFGFFSPALDSAEYNSPEYLYALDKMKSALEHHYKHNRHHPEHFENGIRDMTLVDIVEMVCDWAAASQENPVNMSVQVDRFSISDDMAKVISSTIEENLKKEII